MPGLFGVEPLDRLLGKVPEHATFLLLNDPDVDGQSVLLQAAGHAVREGQDVVYVVTSRTPKNTRSTLSMLGFDADSSHLHFLDAYSGQMAAGDATAALRDPKDLDELASTLETLADDHPDAVLCFDSLSTLADQVGLGRFEAALPDLVKAFDRFAAALCLFTRWPYEKGDPSWQRRFGAVVSLYGVEERIVRNQAVRLDRATWVPKSDHKPLLFSVQKPGGIAVMVPKIVVTGPHDAGKTTFVHAASTEAKSAERMGTTVAMDKGRYLRQGVIADLFGTPGQRRFDPLIDNILEQAQGAILLVDSTHPESIPRAQELLEKVQRRGLHVLAVANKQDLDGAMSAKEVEEKLGIPTLPCSANDTASARRVLHQLIFEMLEGVDPS